MNLNIRDGRITDTTRVLEVQSPIPIFRDTRIQCLRDVPNHSERRTRGGNVRTHMSHLEL